MKFSTALLFSALIGSASAFSAVAPKSTAAATGNPAPIDKSLKGLDSEEGTFDPTSGENPALTRNNNDEVWVQQVRR